VYGPAALTGLTAQGGLLRPAFSPRVRQYDLEMAWNQHSIELTPVLGSAKQVRINDVMSGGEAVRVEPGAEPITVEVAEEGGETVRYTLTPRRNLAAGATATADSFDTKFPPAMAVDGDGTYGDDASRWVSLANAGGHWLALDLGQERRIGRAVVATGHQRAANLPIQAMTLQASADGQAWRDIAGAAVTQNDRNVVELKFAPLTTRHVRLVVGQSPDDRARVYELALYEQ
jgi:hypothetical protein